MRLDTSSKEGSALLLTLLVTSLLLMIVLSLTVQVRLDLRAVQNRMDLQTAKHHAKLSLQLAVAQLQKEAGPDQRLTARAQILGDSVVDQNRFATGVWNSASPNDPPAWLLSQSESSPFSPFSPLPDSRKTLMVGAGTLGENSDPENQIFAEVLPVSSGNQEGGYAFWVSDESVKASLSLFDPFQTASQIDDVDENELRRLRYAVPYRSEQQGAFSESINFESAVPNQVAGRAENLDHFAIGLNVTNPQENGGFHHYTHRSSGLLINPLSGGIKKDLSREPGLLGQGFAEFMDFPSYLLEPTMSHPVIQTSDDFRRAHIMMPPNTFSPSPGEIVHSVTPVITDFGIQFSPKRESSTDGTASLVMSVILELWNPYSTALDAEDLLLEISGVEPFDVTLLDDTDTVVWTGTFEPHEVFGDPISIPLTREQLHSETYTFLEDGSYDQHLHGPGRLLYWTGPDDDHPDQGSFAHRRSASARLVGEVSPAMSFPTGTGTGGYKVGYQMPLSTLSVRLRRPDISGGDLLIDHQDLEYDEVDIADHGTLSYWYRRFLTYRMRMIERGTTRLVDPSLWLKHVDKRTPTPSFGDNITTDSHTMHEEALDYSPGNTSLKNSLSIDQDEREFYFDRVLSNSEWSTSTRRDVPLFELPRQPLISIGQLQHLYIHGMPPYSIGNPWGGTQWNRLFDEYFLSGAQPDISEPDFTTSQTPQLPHPRLAWADPTQLGVSTFDASTLPTLGENAGIAFTVKGQFNLNSVSARAWKAVLGGARLAGLRHLSRDNNLHDSQNSPSLISSDVDFPPGFTRFPQSIQELLNADWENIYNRSEDQNLLNIKSVVTFLNPREDFEGVDTDYNLMDESLLDGLANAISEAIQERTTATGQPYLSVSEFLTEEFQDGKTLLDTVLEEEDLRTMASPGGEWVTEERTPSWLSQADIISALAPFLSTRSDTFLVRGYGNTEDGSEIWCEAIVQRTISPVESVTSFQELANPQNTEFGRRFQIISFKWLSGSDI